MECNASSVATAVCDPRACRVSALVHHDQDQVYISTESHMCALSSDLLNGCSNKKKEGMREKL